MYLLSAWNLELFEQHSYVYINIYIYIYVCVCVCVYACIYRSQTVEQDAKNGQLLRVVNQVGIQGFFISKSCYHIKFKEPNIHYIYQ